MLAIAHTAQDACALARAQEHTLRALHPSERWAAPPGQGRRYTLPVDRPEDLVMARLEALGLSQRRAAAAASDLFRWYVGLHSTPGAIEKGYRRRR